MPACEFEFGAASQRPMLSFSPGDPNMPDDKVARSKPIELRDPSLLKQKSCLNGDWVDADNGATIEVVDPATGATLGTTPWMGAAETRRAIDAANAAWPEWRATTAKERAIILRRRSELIMQH